MAPSPENSRDANEDYTPTIPIPSKEEESGKDSEPSLGPACLVVVILGLAAMLALFAFASFFTFRDQYPLAERAIAEQLIPWIESSQLSPEDQTEIITELQRLRPLLRNREIDPGQLSRLHSCLQDNPVFLWGAVQQVEKQAAQAGLSDLERQTLQRLNERMLRGTADRKLSRNDLDYVLQPVARLRADKQGLETREGLSADEIRQYMKRAEEVLRRNNIPNEPFPHTPGEVFKMLLEEALYGGNENPG